MIRVLLADDHALVREGLARILTESGSCEVVAQASDGLTAVAQAKEFRPQVAVLDIDMPKLSGIEAARRIHAELPQTKVLVVTVHDEEEYVLHMVQAGVAGYMLKDAAASELVKAVEALASGLPFFGPEASRTLARQVRNPGRVLQDPYENLTDREREVFHLIVEGSTTKEIAAELGIALKTAEHHRSNLMEKLDLHSVAELVRYAARKGLLH